MTKTNPTPKFAQRDPSHAALIALKRPVWLTRLGLWTEAIARAFWPLWVTIGLALSAVAFGVQDALPLPLVWGLSALAAVVALGALIWGVWRVRFASWAAAAARLDRATEGRPMQTLTDTLALGGDDPAAQALWRAHLARVAAMAKSARAVPPDLKLSRFDRVGLRYIAAIFVVISVVFGTGFRSDMSFLPVSGGQARATGPAWEGWADPPSYTGLPSLYLNEISGGLSLLQGSRLTMRLYGADGRLSVAETVSQNPGGPPSTEPVQEITVARAGDLSVEGPSGQRWNIAVAVDGAPSIKVDGPLRRVGAGEMRLPFRATDDFGVIAGRADFVLDLDGIARRYGLQTDPEPRAPLSIPIPLTVTGNRAAFREVLAEDFSEHPWANLPVALTLYAQDDLAQTGRSEPFAMVLPGRRFFNPTAAAVIEQRRDLLWSRDNSLRVSQVLRAISHRPDGFMINDAAFLQLSTATARLIGALEDGVTPSVRDEIAALLWDAAVLFEEGSLADALERLERAQEALQEAMRRGASEDEIARLMQELREAMDNYIQQRAQEARNSDTQPQPPRPDSEQITSDQLQDMLDEIERLMNEGRMQEAQALLDQLMQMMENMDVAEGQNGQSPGAQAMEQLQDTLRDQQQLSDDSFQDMQRDDRQGQQPGQSRPQTDAPGAQDLAQRQQDLRDQVEQQRRALPGAGTPEGDAARESLQQAERAMEDAADALEDSDLADALDSQSDAIDALRDGMRDLAEMIDDTQQRRDRRDQDGSRDGGQQDSASTDPLGREAGNQGRMNSEDSLLSGEDTQARARELLDEIRRRSAQQSRPEAEREYLRRLLERF